MASWTTTVGLSGGFTHTLTVTTASQNVAKNQSTLNVVYTMKKNNSGTSYGSASYSVTVDGVAHSGTVSFNMTQGQTVTILSTQQTVTHASDGTKSAAVSFSFGGISDYCPAASGSGTYTPPTIPRASTLSSVPTLTAGSAGTLVIARYSPSFTHTITYNFGGATGTITTKTTSTSVSWTPPVTLLQKIPSASSGWGTLTLTTYSGSTAIGTSSSRFTLTAGSSAVPTVGTVTVSEGTTSVASLLGSSAGTQFVQGVSTATVALSGAAGYQGSTVNRIDVSTPTQSQTLKAASGTVTIPLDDDGSITLTVKVTDTRGKTTTTTKALTVLTYAPPTMDGVTAQRATSAGTVSDSGTNILVGLSAAASSIKPASTELNKMTISLAMAPASGTTFTTDKTVTVSGLSTSSPITSSTSTYAVGSSWSVLITVADKLASSQALLTVATATVLMDWDGQDGIGVGKYRENGSVDAAGDVYARGGLLDPAGIVAPYAGASAPQGWLMCDGSYYSKTSYPDLYAAIGTTYGATSTTFAVPDLRSRVPVGAGPAGASTTTYWGTVGAGLNFPLGESGGEERHTLTTGEMPSHTHGQTGGGFFIQSNSGTDGLASGVSSSRGAAKMSATSAAGGGGAHGNIQPYVALNYIIRA